jgi:hypothetical protein
MATKKTGSFYRSAITGQIVTNKYGKTHPKTVEKETYKRK